MTLNPWKCSGNASSANVSILTRASHPTISNIQDLDLSGDPSELTMREQEEGKREKARAESDLQNFQEHPKRS